MQRFIAALLRLAQIWKQPTCLSAGQGLNCVTTFQAGNLGISSTSVYVHISPKLDFEFTNWKNLKCLLFRSLFPLGFFRGCMKPSLPKKAKLSTSIALLSV